MIKKIVLVTAVLVSAYTGMAQLPVMELTASIQTPYIYYISGDGGLNDFSTGLAKTLNQAGFTIASLNARSYFWSKKSPDQTASEISAYLQSRISTRKNQQIIFIGYSFGADVMPFIINRLPDSLKKRIASVVLLSPSGTTDFEIHVLDMFGTPKKRSMDVVAEINKMGNQKTAIIFGGDETGFSGKAITIKNSFIQTLPGGHHYDGNIREVVNTVMKYF
jgi:type IV secretory pathway VirJ component